MRNTMCQIPLAVWLNYPQHIMRFVDAKKHTAVSCNIKTTHRWSKYKLLNISKHNWHCSVLQCSFELIWMLLLRVPATLKNGAMVKYHFCPYVFLNVPLRTSKYLFECQKKRFPSSKSCRFVPLFQYFMVRYQDTVCCQPNTKRKQLI